jgi:hypothetical protein
MFRRMLAAQIDTELSERSWSSSKSGFWQSFRSPLEQAACVLKSK